MMKELEKGCYVLFLRLTDECSIKIGSLGIHKMPRGLYAYVGSAKGPGGLKARVKRHFKKVKKIKWHIDYLIARPECFIEAAILVRGNNISETSRRDRWNSSHKRFWKQ